MELKQIKEMSKEEAVNHVSRRVYLAALFLERLENAGLCYGNGHHAAQNVANAAVKEVEDRWIKKN